MVDIMIHYLMVLKELKDNNPDKFRKYLKIWNQNIKPNLRNTFFKSIIYFLKILILEDMFLIIMIIIENIV